jgi:hypothetical protein
MIPGPIRIEALDVRAKHDRFTTAHGSRCDVLAYAMLTALPPPPAGTGVSFQSPSSSSSSSGAKSKARAREISAAGVISYLSDLYILDPRSGKWIYPVCQGRAPTKRSGHRCVTGRGGGDGDYDDDDRGAGLCTLATQTSLPPHKCEDMASKVPPPYHHYRSSLTPLVMSAVPWRRVPTWSSVGATTTRATWSTRSCSTPPPSAGPRPASLRWEDRLRWSQDRFTGLQ